MRFAQLAGAIALLAIGVYAGEHPVPITPDANCAECHDAQTKGKFVHSAIAGGCTSCHEIKVAGETVTVNLIQDSKDLCFTCHEKQSGTAVHAPYSAGQCTRCHDPHSSEYPRQLRSAVNDLCLQCHLAGALPADMENTNARIYLDKDHIFGHPYFGHPVAGHPDPLNPKSQMTCLSCHVPHAGSELKLMAPPRKLAADLLNNEAQASNDVCLQCHVQINKDTQESGHRHSYKVSGPASVREPRETIPSPKR